MNTLYEQPSTGSGFRHKAWVAMCGGPILLFVGTGTGGSLDLNPSRQSLTQDSTASATEMTDSPALDAVPAAQALAERISEIKAAFGLTISQLAQVLRVQRQTIYDWIDEDHPPQVQGQNRERLAAIQRLAIQWNALCQWPAGKGVTRYAVDGQTLLDLLSAETLDEVRIITVMRGLSEQVKAEWQHREKCSLANRLRDRGFQPVPEQSLRSVLAGFCGTVSLNDDPS